MPFFLASIILSMLKEEVADTPLKLGAADTGVAAWLAMAANAVVMAIKRVFMVRALSKLIRNTIVTGTSRLLIQAPNKFNDRLIRPPN